MARVVADLEPIRMELLDLLPCHVVLLVLGETKAFRDEECGSEAMFFEQWSHIGRLARDRVVEGQNHGSVRVWFQRICLGNACNNKIQ